MPRQHPSPAKPPPPEWRSLEELADTAEFQAALHREFPVDAAVWEDLPSRREFLQRMAASFALAGLLSGCGDRQRPEAIVPYVELPEGITPGVTQHYATARPDAESPIGLLVESHEGRPTRIAGNPDHPASLGATDVFAQADVLDFYDPDRSRVVRRQGQISDWKTFRLALEPVLSSHRRRRGRGLAILTGRITSPTLLDQLRQLQEAMPELQRTAYEPALTQTVTRGARLAFGQPLSPLYRLQNAAVLLSLDADFLGRGAGKLRLAREFAAGRRVSPEGSGEMNRLYVAETTLTLTGAKADHRHPLRPGRVASLVVGLAKLLGVPGSDGLPQAALDDATSRWLRAAADDLQQAGSRAAVFLGDTHPPELHALAFAINAQLETIGETLEFIDPPLTDGADGPEGLAELCERLGRGEIQTLFVLAADPVFTAPADLDFAACLAKVDQTVHFGVMTNATARACGWHVPATHYLESWSDVITEDGTASIVQPLIDPLYEGRSAHELINLLLSEPHRTAYDIVRTYWQAQHNGENFEQFWQQAVHDGVLPGSSSKTLAPTLRKDAVSQLAAEGDIAFNAEQESEGNDSAAAETVDLVFRPHPTVFDGRCANNAWLQELPQPFTKLTWGTAALISPADAARWELGREDVVVISHDGRELTIPVWPQPGQPQGVVTLHFGQGAPHGGRNAAGTGVNVYPLRTSAAFWHAAGATLRKTGERMPLPSTQHHFLMDAGGIDRHLVRHGTWQEYQQRTDQLSFMPQQHDGEPPTLYPPRERESPQWGMTINLGSCIGCNACTIACQSENNIPVVGPEQVSRGREMHWIRVDTYYSGEPASPRTFHQPVPCMHCEHAPCEVVCPVAATTHSSDGLNEMTYNRCIGTRYCSNNCPYKVRRFNFLDYRKELRELPVLHLLQNPQVTVRSRGVMEKCTYCVQRISAARIQAGMEGRPIRDGEVVTACQAVCPTQAIVFGNIADPDSAVAREKSHPLDYGLLAEEVNTRPRTTYHAALRNPSPRLAASEGNS